MDAKVLVVDDDPESAFLLKTQLEAAGYQVMVALESLKGYQLACQHQPDLIILDVMMPDMDGYQLLERIRQVSNVPALFLTARGSETDALRGFTLGADDYVRKPFNRRELEARVAAILQRAKAQHQDESVYDDGYLRVDLESHLVYRAGELVHLSPTEQKLLECLVQNQGKVVVHEDLLKLVWGSAYKSATVLLSVYISYLREKLEKNPGEPQYILNKWGVGYWFAPQGF